MGNVVVVIGSGSIGQAIARHAGMGKKVLLADLREEDTDAAATAFSNAGYDVIASVVDISLRESVHRLVEKASSLGDITGVIHAAGVSPSQAPIEAILKVDLYGNGFSS